MHVDFISALQWQFNIQRYGSNLINSKCFNSHKIGDHYKDRVYERLCVLSIYRGSSARRGPRLFDLFLVLNREVSSRRWMIYSILTTNVRAACACVRVYSRGQTARSSFFYTVLYVPLICSSNMEFTVINPDPTATCGSGCSKRRLQRVIYLGDRLISKRIPLMTLVVCRFHSFLVTIRNLAI